METTINTCFLCNRTLEETEITTEHQLVSSLCRSTLSHISILNIISNILEDNNNFKETSINSVSYVCSDCFCLLDTIDSLKVQLKLKTSEVINLFENFCNKAKEKPKSKIEHNQNFGENKRKNKNEAVGDSIDVAEPPKKKDKGLLTSDDLKCQICQKTFEKRRYLMDHLRRVHNSSVYKCNKCNSKFKLKEDLNSHEISCTEAEHSSNENVPITQADIPQISKVLTKRKKNNMCNQCEGFFLTQALLKIHIKTVHQGEQLDDVDTVDETKIENPVLCDICNITVNNEYALSIHQGSVHGFDRPWVCHQCGKTFARHLELVNHRRVHSGDKPFQCDICGARFNQKQNLHTHVRHIHLGERRYECNICDMKFRRKRLLDCHINSKHKFERPYTCKMCDATFVYPEHVRKHELTHQVDKTFKCEQCDKTFKNKSSLDNHVSTHRPRDSFQCLTCPLYFLTKEELLTHLKEANHPKGVYSSQTESPDKAVAKDNVDINMSIVESVHVYDDMVLYLASEGVPVHGDADESVYHQDEVQSAISSIVEVENSSGSNK